MTTVDPSLLHKKETRSSMERGPWNALVSGGGWSLLEPRAEDVRFRDIAVGLSRACRFNGHIREDLDFLAVTEHSVLMAEWAANNGVARYAEDAIAILMHDASESFFGDMTTELKKVIPEFRPLEKAAQACIDEAFGLTPERVSLRAAAIKRIDLRMFLAEAEQCLVDPANNALLRKIRQELPGLRPLDVKLEGLAPRASRDRFVHFFLHVIDNMPARDPAWREEIAIHVHEARQMAGLTQSKQLHSERGDAMIFKAYDENDLTGESCAVATMRSMTTDALRKIARAQKGAIATCENRDHLSGLSGERRKLWVASMGDLGLKLADRRAVPGPSPSAFLKSMAEPQEATGLVATFKAALPLRKKKDSDVELRGKLETFLATYPGFSAADFREGKPQSDEFMAEFAIDYPVLREISFEARKVLLTLLNEEKDFHACVEVHDQFAREVRGGRNAAELALFQDKLARESSRRSTHDEMSPA